MPRQPLPFHLVNAFAATPHAGNQAAVVIIPADDPRATDEKWMLEVAADFNLSETAFLVPIDAEAEIPKYGLRWFTPAVEVPLCGHATFASAFTLFNYVHPKAKALHFETRWRGALGATLESERGQGARVGLTLPISDAEVTPESTALAARIAGALSLAESSIVKIASFAFGGPSAVVQIKDDVDLAALKPAEIAKLMPDVSVAAVTQLIESKSTPETLAITARVFGPGVGIDEDPVTGSAWAVLTGYYLNGAGVETTRKVIGPAADSTKVTIDARQLSARGGAMTIDLQQDKAQLVGSGFRYGYGTLEAFD